LRVKGSGKEGELRYETDDKPPKGKEAYEPIGATIDELVIMDECAFVLQNKKEYVYKKGHCYQENNIDQIKEYDAAFSLVAPATMGPRILLL